MARYKLSNALRHCDPQEFKSDKAAWNSLRKHFLFKEDDGTVSGCYIWMWKEIEIDVPINNEEEYVKMHNAKYGPRPYGYGPDNAKLLKVGELSKSTVWIPVLEAITTHPYKVNKKVRK
jgi:hypothetical protein